MKQKLSRIVPILFVASLVLAPIISISRSAPEVPNGPYVDKVLIFKMTDQDKVVSMIESGEMDAWDYWFTKEEALAAARASAQVNVLEVSSTYDDLLLNPVATREGFNPFTIAEVREALNWIIDRKYLAEEIINGRGIPRWTVFRTMAPDYVRNIVFMKDLEAKYAYDFEKGKEAISRALADAGCEYVAGKWYYGGNPIVLKFLIRVGDERTPIGDYIASQLEKVGFTVERRYGTSGDASRLVWQADPREGTFHLYTGGWIATAITAYDDGDPEFFFNNQYAAGRILSYWSQPEEFANLLRKLAIGNYTTMQERNTLIQQVAEACLENSFRLFLVDMVSAWPMTKNLEIVPYDLYGGLVWRYTLAGMKLKDQVGGTLRIGNRYVLEGDAFNPIGGTNWLYDRIALDPVYDTGVWPHPFTGLYMPVRTNFIVNTAGPTGTLDVPSDAITFSVPDDNWVTVATGTTATSKVTFNYILGKWHDGTPMTMADVMSSIAIIFETVSEESPLYDPDAASVSPALLTYIQKLKGIKVLNSTAMEVYIDYWHVDETYIAAQALSFPASPWQLNEVMKAAVAAKEAAFGLSYANEWGVEWLDLARGPSLGILKKHFDRLKAENYIPAFLSQWVTEQEASSGYSAIGNWYSRYGMFLISNGPFMMTKVDPTALQIELTAFREYPIKADYWAQFSTPKVPDVRVSGPEEIERRSEATFTVDTTYGGVGYTDVAVSAMLLSATGRPIQFPGVSASSTPGRFLIELTADETARMPPGAYTLRVIAVGQEAAIPVVKDFPFTAIAELSYFDREIRRIDSDLNSRYTSLSGQLEQINQRLDQLAGAVGNVNVSLVVGVLGLILGAVALYRSSKKS
ncbi:MAG: ABC transporter substrate-binding protein [Thermoproteota archaeon]